MNSIVSEFSPIHYSGVSCSILSNQGEVTERFKVPVLKTGVPSRVPRVRIPPSPPDLGAEVFTSDSKSEDEAIDSNP